MNLEDNTPGQTEGMEDNATLAQEKGMNDLEGQVSNDGLASENELFTESPQAGAAQPSLVQSSTPTLQQEVETLQSTKTRLQREQQNLIEQMGKLVSDTLGQLEQRKQALQLEVDKLERRRDRIQQEMRTTFAGASQDLAIRVQGFKDYLVGSLQDLASTAEQLDLIPQAPSQPQSSPELTKERAPERLRERVSERMPDRGSDRMPSERSSRRRQAPGTPPEAAPVPQFAESGFQAQAQQVRQLLDRYRTDPDYYGPPWQLRRTFEPIHAKRVANWFFTQGGRGALRTMGSRLQNILIASAVVSILRTMHDRRVCTLILANTPERLGEWRRGLQDCLGIDRRDFGPEQGVVLFEDANILAQKADRLVQQGRLPLIIVDDSEDKISLALLQYPLWLAFAPEPTTQPTQEQLY
ncbi:MAG: DUF3086 domain-containing protein [Microcoleaceae cyanobacterium]